MANWKFNPSDFVERRFEIIPEGDHRVVIKNVEEKIFSTGNEGFEITLDVEGFTSKLWYCLVLDPENPAKTNQRLGMFFDSFAIKDYDLSNYFNWIGKDGAVRVRHNTYNGRQNANVAFCLGRSQQDRIVARDNVYAQRCMQVSSTTCQRKELVFDGFSF